MSNFLTPGFWLLASLDSSLPFRSTDVIHNLLLALSRLVRSRTFGVVSTATSKMLHYSSLAIVFGCHRVSKLSEDYISLLLQSFIILYKYE